VLESDSVIPDLDALIQLQHADASLRRVEAELAALPSARAEVEARLGAERGRLEAAKAALDGCQKARRQHEGAVQDFEAKRSKYKGQLMEVKTNKEYTAMLHEIEAVEREIRAREDLILAEMEQAENLAADVKREEALFKAEEERGKGELRAIDERRKALEATLVGLTEERDGAATKVSPARLELFKRVAKARGDAVAEARDEMCVACHVRLRPQMFMEIKRNDEIMQCPSCGRVLYYEPPPPVVAPHP
jgi:predicted  nucleic acid-binding Zn-ribbon protein